MSTLELTKHTWSHKFRPWVTIALFSAWSIVAAPKQREQGESNKDKKNTGFEAVVHVIHRDIDSDVEKSDQELEKI